MANFNLLGRPSTGGVSQLASGDVLLLASGITVDFTLGSAKLPLQFFINNVQLSASFTGANANTLVAGAASNADALHTHTAVQAGSLVYPGLTLWATPVVGEVGYISANVTAAKARANSTTTARAVGVYNGVAGTLTIGGATSVFLQSGLNAGTAPAAGQVVFVSPTTAGQWTNVAPNTAGQQEVTFAVLVNVTGYDNTNGSAHAAILHTYGYISL